MRCWRKARERPPPARSGSVAAAVGLSLGLLFVGLLGHAVGGLVHLLGRLARAGGDGGADLLGLFLQRRTGFGGGFLSLVAGGFGAFAGAILLGFGAGRGAQRQGGDGGEDGSGAQAHDLV